MIAALWANPNWDDTKESQGGRKRAIDSINDDFAETVEAIEAAYSTRMVPDEKKLSDDNPFFAAAERGLEKVIQNATTVANPGRAKQDKTGEEIDYMKDVDQN